MDLRPPGAPSGGRCPRRGAACRVDGNVRYGFFHVARTSCRTGHRWRGSQVSLIWRPGQERRCAGRCQYGTTQARSPSTASCVLSQTGRRSATTKSIRSRTAGRTNTTPPGLRSPPSSGNGPPTPFVCYDLRFADLFWPVATSTDCYLVVANWPSPRQSHFRALAVARAIENQAYVLATNRVGTGGGLHYGGGTIAVGAFLVRCWPRPVMAKRRCM